MAGRTDDFFGSLPRRAVVNFNLAVFFVFAPLGLLFVSSLEPARAFWPVVASLIVSGLIAVCWAATFTISRWFIVGIVLTNLLMTALNTSLADSPVGIGTARPSLVGWTLIVSIVLGYVLFVMFISGQGRTTLRLMTELSLARSIHETLVPEVRFEGNGIEALGSSAASTEMGGDLIDVVGHGDGTDLFVADVSGHGVRAGVVMGMVKSAIRMGLRNRRDLSELLADLNDVLEGTTRGELYATLVGLRIDGRGCVEYALAGHHPFAHYQAASSELRRLGKPTFPLGLFDGRTYATDTLTLGPGDLLAVWTDGLNETADAGERELGHEPIERTLVRLWDRPLGEIRAAVLDLVAAHGAQADDRTLLLVRWRG